MPWKWTLLSRQWAICLILIGYGFAAGFTKWWPFNGATETLPKNPTVWQFIFSDRITVGLVRAGILGVGAFIILSVPALVLAGRWMKSFGSGLGADAAEADRLVVDQTETLRETEKKLEQTQKDFDQYRQTSEQLLGLLRAELGVQEPEPPAPTGPADGTEDRSPEG